MGLVVNEAELPQGGTVVLAVAKYVKTYYNPLNFILIISRVASQLLGFIYLFICFNLLLPRCHI